MLHDVRVRTIDRQRKLEVIEVLTVDAAGGDEAAEMALALRPTAFVVGVAPTGNLAREPVALEGESAASEDDETAEPGPSKREMAEAEARRSRRPR